MANARTSSGNDSLTVRYAELAAADAKKKTTAKAQVWVAALRAPTTNNHAVTPSNTPEAA
jgi:hypothetical protein